MGRRRKRFGFSFSWKRALGLSAMKGKASRRIGVPLTRQGRERKAGGCMLGLLGLGGRKRGRKGKRRKKRGARHIRL